MFLALRHNVPGSRLDHRTQLGKIYLGAIMILNFTVYHISLLYDTEIVTFKVHLKIKYSQIKELGSLALMPEARESNGDLMGVIGRCVN